MKKSLSALAVGTLFSVAGFANASEPMQLSDSQMDTVAAGGMESIATTSGSAKFGKVFSQAETKAVQTWFGRRTTTASASTLAIGYKVTASATAGSSF